MRAIVRTDTGGDCKAHLKRLARSAGLENPTDAALARFDRQRKDKTTSNAEQVSPDQRGQPDREEEGTVARLEYKAERAVDLGSGLLRAADTVTLVDGLLPTQVNLVRAGLGTAVEPGGPATPLLRRGEGGLPTPGRRSSQGANSGAGLIRTSCGAEGNQRGRTLTVELVQPSADTVGAHFAGES